jgi:hypothetical protein
MLFRTLFGELTVPVTATRCNFRQAVTAAASGCQAALDAEKWLLEQPQEEFNGAVRIITVASSPSSAPVIQGGEEAFNASRKSIANAWLAVRRFASSQWLKVRRRSKE